jgi:hypothetical protein
MLHACADSACPVEVQQNHETSCTRLMDGGYCFARRTGLLDSAGACDT